MRLLCRFFSFIVLALFCSACYTVPYSNRSQFILTPESTDIAQGDEAWAEYVPTVTKSTDAKFTSAVKRVGDALVKAANKPEYNWEFLSVETDEANAFCLPGGKIAVYKGIYQMMDNDAELACVVAHEIAHALARHSAGRQAQQILLNMGAATVQAADDSGVSASIYSVGAQVAAILPYSREQEYEADYIGCILMAKAGYNPQYALSFWTKMSQAYGDGSALENFLSTHPINAKRVAAMKEKMSEFEGYYNQSTKKDTGTKF